MPEINKDVPEIKVGDHVNYVPHEDHKFDHVLRGGSIELPWVLGLKTVRNGKEEVEELSGIRLTQVLEGNKKGQIKPPSAIVTIRPNITWDAVVTAVYPVDDKSPAGHVDLRIDTERGWTLLYGAGNGTQRINIDHDLVGHHCCHHKSVQSKFKHCDGLPLSNTDSLSVVAALNEKVAALIAAKQKLEAENKALKAAQK